MLLLVSPTQSGSARANLAQAVENGAEPSVPQSWAEVSPSVRSCVTTAYSQDDITVDKLIAASVPPSDQRIYPVVNACIKIMAINLKTNLKCRWTDGQGKIAEAPCEEGFTKYVNGNPSRISRDEYIQLYVRGEKVEIRNFQSSNNQDQEKNRKILDSFGLTNAKWEKLPGGGAFGESIDRVGMKAGSKWREYTKYTPVPGTVEVNGNSVKYTATISREIASCPYKFEQYHVLLGTLYFDGSGPKGKVVHLDLKPRGIYNFSQQRNDINFICSIDKPGDYNISAEHMSYIDEVRRDHAPILASLKKQYQREEAEMANRPRGYHMICRGSAPPADMNIRTVNCSSIAEVNASLRWAWSAIRQERPDFAKTCMEAIYQLDRQSDPEVLRRAAPGALARCNTGLGFLDGPSRVQAGAAKK